MEYRVTLTYGNGVVFHPRLNAQVIRVQNSSRPSGEKVENYDSLDILSRTVCLNLYIFLY